MNILGISIDNFDDAMNWIGFILRNWGVWLLIFFIYMFMFKPETLHIFFANILNIFSFMGSNIKKARISHSISGDVIRATKKASKELEEFMPFDVSIKWLKSSEREAFINSGKVVLCLSNDKQESYVIVKAVYDYVKCSLLHKEKPVLEHEIYLSSILTMTRRLLKEGYNKGISTFFDKITPKEMNNNKQVDELFTKLIEIDESGFFTNVFMKELIKKCSMVHGRLTNRDFNDETENFITFLYDIAIRDPGSTNQLCFSGKYYKVGIILIASLKTYESGGIEPYIKRYNQYVRDSFDGIYLYAKESRKKIINSVIENIKNQSSCESISNIKFNAQNKNGEVYNAECYDIKAKKVS
jgi:hypothetical protein